MVQELLQKVKKFPRIPGVYIFRNAQGRAIYVGKAKRLRDRVGSYFQKPLESDRARRTSLLAQARDIEIRPTDSEIEAFILEAYLIKRFRPRFNIALRDDKQYFYVGFTRGNFPKVVITHQEKIALSPRSTLIGPFVNGRALRITLRALRKIFPYCTCTKTHMSERTCLNYHMGLDPGFCCRKEASLTTKTAIAAAKQASMRYRKNINRIRQILSGKKARVLATLNQEMERAAARQQFEKAATLRDQLEGLENVLAHKRVIAEEKQGTKKLPSRIIPENSLIGQARRIEGYDISNVQGQFAVGSMVVFERNEQGIMAPKRSDYRRFKIKTVPSANDPAMMREVMTRRLRHKEWALPDIMLIDGGITQRTAVVQAFATSHMPGKEHITIWGLAKEHEELYTGSDKIRLATIDPGEAATLQYVRDEAHRFAITYYRFRHLRNLTPRKRPLV